MTTTIIACTITAIVFWAVGVRMGGKFAVREMVRKTTGDETFDL